MRSRTSSDWARRANDAAARSSSSSSSTAASSPATISAGRNAAHAPPARIAATRPSTTERVR